MTSLPKPFGLRLPDDMKVWVAARAVNNGRSMNKEIAQIIKVQMAAETRRKPLVLKKPAKAGA